MAITLTLSNLRGYFLGWHENEYDEIHHITDDIISDTSDVRSKYALSSYGASQLQTQVGNINLNGYVTTTSFNNHVNKKSSTSEYGHVKIIDDLTKSTYTAGEVLSAHQGYELNQNIASASRRISKLESQITNYRMYVGRLGFKNDNTKEMYTYNDIANITDADIDSMLHDANDWHGFKQSRKIVIQPGYYVIAVIIDEAGNPQINQNVVFNLNGIPYFRQTSMHGIAGVAIKWGYSTPAESQQNPTEATRKRRSWADTWHWIEVTALPNDNNPGDEKFLDKSLHKIVNLDPDFFDESYNPEHESNRNKSQAEKDAIVALWRSELNIPADKNQIDYKDDYDKLRRKTVENHYPNSIN